MAPIRRITAWVDFDPPVEDREEAIQTLMEAVGDDGAELSIDYAEEEA